ncbi:hypothetical protein Slala04_02240 [Streptomyces lavendulae subsp. lavendulae]|nr:hypothetical protein Slala04_02240 [Streptomyces lavendulae subsp. lavendulae]
MPQPTPDTRIHFALHPGHPPAVTATVTGPRSTEAQVALAARGFRDTGAGFMVLARIDREEPYYTQQTAQELQHDYDVGIEPALQEEIDTEWAWGDHPMTHLTREEIRQVSATAQQIHDDIAAGRLKIHLHAHDGWTTVAVGTYTDGHSVHLHGEDHLRHFALVYDDEAEAVAEFHRLHSVAVRPGPAPATDTELAAAAAHTPLTPHRAPADHDSQATVREAPPAARVHTADPRVGEALLESFFETNPDWWKVRTWSDEATVACHESLAMRVEFDHEARHRRDVAWTVAVYDSPVGERLWHATASATTPIDLVQTLLDSLTSNEPRWGPPPTGGALQPIDATRTLLEARWTQTSSARYVAWQAPDGSSSLHLNTYAAENPASQLPAWSIIGGTDPNRPDWAIDLSAAVTPDILAHLTDHLAACAPPAPRRTGTPSLPATPTSATTTTPARPRCH